MDRATYERNFGRFRPSNLSIYLDRGADATSVSERLVQKTADRFLLVFTTNRSLRAEIMRIFDATFRITYALEIIAIVAAGLGVVSTLITLILERRREISILRFIGAARSQIRRMIITEAIVIAAVSQAIGTATGLLLSFVLVYVINVQSFGWTIQFSIPYRFLAESTGLIVIIAAIAGLYPAMRAANLNAARLVREE